MKMDNYEKKQLEEVREELKQELEKAKIEKQIQETKEQIEKIKNGNKKKSNPDEKNWFDKFQDFCEKYG